MLCFFQRIIERKAPLSRRTKDDISFHEVKSRWMIASEDAKKPKEEERTPSVRPAVVQLPLLFNFVGKGSDAKPHQSDLQSSSSPYATCALLLSARGARDIAI